MMPVRTDTFSQMCFSPGHVQWIFFLTWHPFLHNTYLSSKFLTTWFDYNPSMIIIVFLLDVSSAFAKPREQLKMVCSKHGQLKYYTMYKIRPFLLSSDPIPTCLIKMAGQPSCLNHNRIRMPSGSHQDNQGWKEEYCLKYRA